MSAIETVVVAIDFSENASDAVNAARDVVSNRRARLHLLHVVPDVFSTPWMVESAGVDFEAVQQRWIEEAQQKLDSLAARLGLDPLLVTTHVAAGSPAAAIVRYAGEQPADLVVLGSHGHGLIRRFMLGSVADRVIRHSACPVLVVPHRSLRERHATAVASQTVE